MVYDCVINVRFGNYLKYQINVHMGNPYNEA